MKKNFVGYVKEKEGFDLTEKNLIVEIGEEEEAEQLLTALKKAGYVWVYEEKEIDPYNDARNSDLFFLCDPVDVVIDAVSGALWSDNRGDIAENDDYDSFYQMSLDKFLRYMEECKSFKEKPLALLNTSILTTAGEYKLTDISLDEAKALVNDAVELDSAIGHQSTAEIMTTLLGTEVAVNRQMFTQEVGQQALVFKLNGRPEEGKILTTEEIEKIGYKFQLLERTK